MLRHHLWYIDGGVGDAQVMGSFYLLFVNPHNDKDDNMRACTLVPCRAMCSRGFTNMAPRYARSERFGLLPGAVLPGRTISPGTDAKSSSGAPVLSCDNPSTITSFPMGPASNNDQAVLLWLDAFFVFVFVQKERMKNNT